MKKVCVIGYPAKHSLSPVIHNYWLDKYDIQGKYEIREVEPNNFDNFFRNLYNEGYVGCNITVPFKEAAFKIAKELGSEIGTIENVAAAINTVLINDGKYIVKNSDAPGFNVNLQESVKEFDFKKGKVVVIGAGGAARGIITGIITKHVPEVILLNRTIENAEQIKKEIKNKISKDIKVISWDKLNESLAGANLLINTTSLGMIGQPPLEINLHHLPKDAIVTDIVYRPLVTPLLKAAQQRGNQIVDGLGMLLYQAVPGFNMWFSEELKSRGISSVEVTKELREKVESLL